MKFKATQAPYVTSTILHDESVFTQFHGNL